MARNALGRLPFIGTLLLAVTGVAGIVVLFLTDTQPHFASTAYAAFSEVEDSPIEDLADRQPGVIHRARDGLFHATLHVNDRPLRCIIDTGASATVLGAADSRRLGIADGIRFNGRIHTVGGEHAAARGRLDEVVVAGHSFRHVPAFIVRDTPTPCLLGQDLLARLDTVEIHGDEIILR